MLPVKKVKYDGPHHFQDIIRQIASDAEKEGYGHLNEELIRKVISRTFSYGGVFRAIPMLSIAKVKYFGKFHPERKITIMWRELKRLNRRYAFKISPIQRSLRTMRKNNEVLYQKYVDNCTADIVLPYDAWYRVSGRRKKILAKGKKIRSLRDKERKIKNRIREKYLS